MRHGLGELFHADACSTSLTVAGLRLALDAQESGIPLALPPAHAKFTHSDDPGGLRLIVRSGQLRQPDGWRPMCAAWKETWQLWQDAAGRYVFASGEGSRPGRQVTVDPGFETGEVLVAPERGGRPSGPVDPLAGLDMILYANWLANLGDLVLHASGAEFGGRGYCFAGCSGAGKSTLAGAFKEAGLTVLGEDSLVLRYVDGRFWIFGTPWHLDPERCSPLGVPLDRLFFLDRSKPHGASRCPAGEGAVRLLSTAFLPYYRQDAVERIVDRVALLGQRVPFDILSHRLGSDVMELFRQG